MSEKYDAFEKFVNTRLFRPKMTRDEKERVDALVVASSLHLIATADENGWSNAMEPVSVYTISAAWKASGHVVRALEMNRPVEKRTRGWRVWARVQAMTMIVSYVIGMLNGGADEPVE